MVSISQLTRKACIKMKRIGLVDPEQRKMRMEKSCHCLNFTAHNSHMHMHLTAYNICISQLHFHVPSHFCFPTHFLQYAFYSLHISIAFAANLSSSEISLRSQHEARLPLQHEARVRFVRARSGEKRGLRVHPYSSFTLHITIHNSQFVIP